MICLVHTPIPHPPSLHFLQSLILIKSTIMTTATAFWKNSLTWLVCSAVTSLHQSPGPSAAMPCHTQRAAGNCARFAVPVPFRFERFLHLFVSAHHRSSYWTWLPFHLHVVILWHVPPTFVLAHCVNRPGYGPVGSTAQILPGLYQSIYGRRS